MPSSAMEKTGQIYFHSRRSRRLIYCKACLVQLSPRVVFLVHIVQSQSTQASNFSDENKQEDTFQIH